MAAEADAFTCHRRNDLRALNYLYVTGDPEQFRFPFSEMRGLIVDEAGAVTARPFQKFWNWQEPGAAVAACPWDEGCEITAKMDGSLVYPAWYGDNEHVWCTRSGPTDIAELVLDFIDDDINRNEMTTSTATNSGNSVGSCTTAAAISAATARCARRSSSSARRETRSSSATSTRA